MADPAGYGILERDIEQAIVALKKGTQLIKYSRKGKPKFCLFRISADETTLIWYSRGQERNLKLSLVSRIIPGQRTAVFRRYLRPEKDYLSFSLLYNNGERSLDLICKDKAEAELWFAGLKELIPSGQRIRPSRSGFFEQQESSDIIQNRSPLRASFDLSSIASGRVSIDLNSTRESPLNIAGSDVASERASMQLRTSTGDGFRLSVSSTPSCSSGGSGPDDIESLGDVYLWGEVWLDGTLRDGSVSPIPAKTDVLTPRPLESNVVLDVHQISCGVRHLALVTRQGEVFTWGEESGGRLGHGIDKNFSRPRLVESLAINIIDFVACGEYHSCAVSTTGDLFTWGDGAHNAGLLGLGTDVSHWIPKRVNGPLEGLQVFSVACGTWHTALATSNGKLFTFGDGSFGVLGHGDRQSVSYPKEVQLLNGLKTLKVACGVWHTAAIVEVAGQPGSSISSRKLFTWGDGDKHRLGHGNKETYLLPTCVSSLVDYNFHQLGCGHTMTIALTTSGHVFTMGGTSYGQLGNPSSDGKTPCLVQDRLVGEFVEEISCGANHVAVLTSRSEVFTWGKGANGRLGHGDTEDRKTPTLVEALKDRHVKNISCGSNFTTSICIHKWVSGADQSVCSGCRQAFGFTRKRHNCYNCGLVHCHACSSRKAFRAALAPTPGKPHRVCDACYAKLKAAEVDNGSTYNRKATTATRSIDSRDYSSRGERRSSKVLLSSTTEPVKFLEVRPGRAGSKSDYSSMVRAVQVPSLLPLKDVAIPSSPRASKPVMPTSPHPSVNSRPSSPYTRRLSPPRSITPVFSKSVVDNVKKSNELLTQEVSKLLSQVKSLKQKCDVQETEMQNLKRDAKAAALLVEGHSSKCKVANELVKSFTEQLKALTEKLPPEDSENEIMKSLQARAEDFLNTSTATTSENERDHRHATHLSNQHSSDGGDTSPHSDRPSVSSSREDETQPSSKDNSKSHGSSTSKAERGKEVIEQFEPGVYVTLIQLQNGTKIFRRVRFSKRRFSEQQAEEWWNNNKDRLLKTYSVPQKPNPAHTESSSTATPAPAEESSQAASSS